MRNNLPLLIAGVMCLCAAVLLGGGGLAIAQETPEPEPPPLPPTSVLHPAFPMLDASGADALTSGEPVSTMQTCGTCHDTAFIEQHSVHTDAGQRLIGQVADSRAWVDGVGWFGGWDPIRYMPVDQSIEDWLRVYGWRHVGGGPAAEVGSEMNCFLCHLPGADNAARVAALAAGDFAWANTATLNGTGIVQATDDGWALDPAAFDDEGRLLRAYITLAAPTDESCGFCHGVVDTTAQTPLLFTPGDPAQWTTLTTGQVFSPERMHTSGLNIAGKADLSRSWDVHAERVVGCTDCHYSLNNPVFYVEPEGSRPDHLDFDPRRMDYDDFLLRPLHQFANGGSAYAGAFPVFERAVRDCATCHDATATHQWLEYTERHLNVLACESCHIPTAYAPALASIDWTVLGADGGPQMRYRGADETAQPALITGYEPVLLPDADDRLTPYNIVSAWYWVHGDPAQPVTQDALAAVFFDNASDDGATYAAEVIAAFDADGDGLLSEAERVIDDAAKEAVIAERLAALGLADPRIMAEANAYPLHHSVTHGAWATRDCATCHTGDSRLNAAFLLSSQTPGGVLPTFINHADADAIAGSIETAADGGLYFTPVLAVGQNGLYILGHHSVPLVDIAGTLIFLGAAFAVSVHAGLRVLLARRLPRPAEPELRDLYMYSIYERQWHWLQTVAIFGLIFTGLVIHRPDSFAMFSFRGMVLVHNALALILVINAALAAFYHLVSGEIKQFLPEPRGFFGQMFAQARYYAWGIFRGEPHPFEKTRHRKMNPIQQVTYFGLLNVLLPFQVITGVLMWGAQRFPTITDFVGGLPLLGPLHTFGSWLLATFIVVHVYMTTTGHTPLANLRAMVFGWDEVEVHAAGGEASHAS